MLWRALSFATDATDAEHRGLALTAALDAAAAQQRGPEVALLVMPGLIDLSAEAFDAVHVAIRGRYEALANPLFYVVAFHPAYPVDARNVHTLVRFFRRSPEPTLQFVRRSVLAPLRRAADEAGRVRLASDMIAAGASAEELSVALKPPRDLSLLVAENNAQRFATLGPDALASTLTTLIAAAKEASLTAACEPTWQDWPWTVVDSADDPAQRFATIPGA
jgi:hypothetical protein